jgi:hypothetical protein
MNREQMVEKAASLIIASDQTLLVPNMAHFNRLANAILDAILPQVTTVEELEALDGDVVLVSESGATWRTYRLRSGTVLLSPGNQKTPRFHPEVVLSDQGPLTVVWQPS